MQRNLLAVIDKLIDLASATDRLADVVRETLRNQPDPFPHAGVVVDNVRWDVQGLKKELEELAVALDA